MRIKTIKLFIISLKLFVSVLNDENINLKTAKSVI